MTATRHEPATLHAGGLLRAAGGGLAVLLAVLAAVGLAWRHGPELAPPVPAAAHPPEPRLQRNAPADLAALHRRQAERLRRYAWLDREHHYAQIPIERAMALEAATARGTAAPEGRR